MGSLVQLFSLEGRAAVVTGGTRGIGSAMAIALAEAGADIILIQVRGIRSSKAKGRLRFNSVLVSVGS